MDHNLRLEKSRLTNSVAVNIAAKASHPSVNQKSSKTDIRCQICTRKGHSAADCYNQLNLDRYPASHGRILSPLGPNRSARSQTTANLVTSSAGTATMWYPDSGATSPPLLRIFSVWEHSTVKFSQQMAAHYRSLILVKAKLFQIPIALLIVIYF